MPYEPPPELAGLSLAQIAEAVAARRLPPLDRWSPADEGDSRMRIAADGRWFHDGSPITRPAMVRAFAGLLTRDAAGRHWLMTPHQRLSIEVEDAPFVAVDMTVQADADGREALAFRLNTDEFVIAGPDHPLRVDGPAERPAAYLAVRHGTEARLDRGTWLQLAEHALARGEDPPAVESGGVRFVLAAGRGE